VRCECLTEATGDVGVSEGLVPARTANRLKMKGLTSFDPLRSKRINFI